MGFEEIFKETCMLTGFLLPPLWLTSNAITPGQVLRYYRFLSAGVV
jgi:hypothetical protein